MHIPLDDVASMAAVEVEVIFFIACFLRKNDLLLVGVLDDLTVLFIFILDYLIVLVVCIGYSSVA